MARLPLPDNMKHPLTAPMTAPRWLIKCLDHGVTNSRKHTKAGTDTALRPLSFTELPGPVGTTWHIDTTYHANHNDPASRGPNYLGKWFSIYQIDPTSNKFPRLVFAGRVDGPALDFSESPSNFRTLNLRDHWFLLGKRILSMDASRLTIGAALYRIHVDAFPYSLWPTDENGDRVVSLDPALFAETGLVGVYYRNQTAAAVIADLIARMGNHIAVIDYDEGAPVIRARELGKTTHNLVVGTVSDSAPNHTLVPFCQSYSIRKDFNAQHARAIGTGGRAQTQKTFALTPAWDTTNTAAEAAVLADEGAATLAANDWIGTCYEIPEAAAGLLLKPIPALPSAADPVQSRRGAVLMARSTENPNWTEYRGNWKPMVKDPSGQLTTVFDEIPRVSTNRRWYVKLDAPAIANDRAAAAQAAYLANAAAVLAGGTPADPAGFVPTPEFFDLELQAVTFGGFLAADSGDVGGEYYPDPTSFFAIENPDAVRQVLETAYEIDASRQRTATETHKKTLRDDTAGLQSQTNAAANAKAKPTVAGSYRLDNVYNLFRLGDGIGEIINTEGTVIEEALGVAVGQRSVDCQEFAETLTPNDLLPQLTGGNH